MSIGRYRLLLFVLCAAVILAALPASASTVTYTDPTAWASATSDTTDIDFTGLAPAGGTTDYSTPTGLVISGVDFVGDLLNTSLYQLAVMDQNYASPWWNWGAPATLMGPIYNLPANPSFVPYIQANLPTGVTAFAVDLATLDPNALSYQITLSDGEVFTVPTNAAPSLAFFGVTTDDPITYADFTVIGMGTYSGTYGLMTNFQFGTATTQQEGPPPPGDVPEASTMLLIGSGLIGFPLLRKKIRFNFLT